MIAALFLALQSAGVEQQRAVDAAHLDRMMQAYRPWSTCVAVSARNWAAQTAEPSEIAEGAFGKCAVLEDAVEEAIASNPIMDEPSARRIFAEMRSRLRRLAVAVILDERSRSVRRVRTK